MIRQKKRKVLTEIAIAVCVCSIWACLRVYASSGDVAGAIEYTWKEASGQIKTVVDNVVFRVLDLVLGVFFFIKLGTAYFDYRKHGQFEWAAPSILFVCLVFTLTAPHYIWQVVGI